MAAHALGRPYLEPVVFSQLDNVVVVTLIPTGRIQDQESPFVGVHEAIHDGKLQKVSPTVRVETNIRPLSVRGFIIMLPLFHAYGVRSVSYSSPLTPVALEHSLRLPSVTAIAVGRLSGSTRPELPNVDRVQCVHIVNCVSVRLLTV